MFVLGKRFFLQLAADVVNEVNTYVDSEGLNMAQKSMIRCGLGLNREGKWRIEMLFPHLQEIIKTFPENFNGTPAAVEE